MFSETPTCFLFRLMIAYKLDWHYFQFFYNKIPIFRHGEFEGTGQSFFFYFWFVCYLLIKPKTKTKLRTTVPETFIYRPNHLLLPIIIIIIITNEKYTYFAFMLFLCFILVKFIKFFALIN